MSNAPNLTIRRAPGKPVLPHMTDAEIATVVSDWPRWGRLSDAMELAIIRAVCHRKAPQMEMELAA